MVVAAPAGNVYLRPVPCEELQNLRREATRLTVELDHRRKKAREKANTEGGGRIPGRSDYEDFLQRKISKLAAEIENHMAQHQCPDL